MSCRRIPQAGHGVWGSYYAFGASPMPEMQTALEALVAWVRADDVPGTSRTSANETLGNAITSDNVHTLVGITRGNFRSAEDDQQPNADMTVKPCILTGCSCVYAGSVPPILGYFSMRNDSEIFPRSVLRIECPFVAVSGQTPHQEKIRDLPQIK